MTTPELYFECQLLLNKGGTGLYSDVPVATFVTIFNREQEKWLKLNLPKAADTDDIQNFQQLLVPEYPLVKQDVTSKYVSFLLPEDWFSIDQIHPAKATQQKVTRNLYVRFIKNKNINELLQDPLNNPSFDWEETFAFVGNEQLHVYYTDFSIDSISISYYKKPNKIDLIGYTNFDKLPSKTVNSNLDDVYLREILDMTVRELQRIFENPQGFQLAQERIATETDHTT